MNGASGSTLRSWATVWRRLLPLLVITLLVGALSLWAYRVFSVEILAIEQHALTVALTLATLLALILIYGAGFELWRWDRRRRAAIALEREQALQRQEQRTRCLLDAILACSTDAIFAKDLEGRYILANHACAAGLGLTVEQLLGHRDDERLPPAVVATLAEVESRVLAGETFVNVEQRLVLSGDERVYLTTKAPLRDAEGAIIGLYGIARDISERKRQEAERRATEATAARLQGELRWKETIDRVGHGTWEWDIRAGRFERSPTMARLLGLEPTELDADMDGCLRRLHPDDRVVVESKLRAVIAGDRGDYEARYRSLHRDGGWRWFLSRGLVSERGPDGAPWRMIGTLTDITAWQEAEERLLISREHLRMATEGAELGVWYWDLVAQKLNWSALCQEHMALPLGTEPSLDHFYDAVHPDDRARVEGQIQAAIDAAGEYHAEYRILHPDGRLRWISTAGRVYLDAEGHPMGMGGITKDITARKEDELVLNDQRERLQSAVADLEAEIAERRKVEADLVRSEEHAREKSIELEGIYANAPVGLFVLDRDLRFLRLNERLAEINGLPVAAHLGRSIREIVPDLAEAAEPLFQGVIDRDEPRLNIALSGETVAQPGIRRHWREHVYPLKNADGRVVGLNGVVEEITEIKRIEDELRALNTELEAKVEARTAEARAASAAKSEFLAHMSHEIRTPLNAVLGLVQIVEQSPLNPEQRDLIARIRIAGRSLLLLLNDILDFSKIEAGQLQLEERPFVPAPLLEQLDSLLGLTARAKGLRFTIDAAPLPDGALVGDPLRLEQILTNLIGNAIKFTNQGEVRLHIRTLESDDDRARLRFEITDTGIGIAPEVLPLLFAAFNQGDSGISRRFGGTGLGLAISKRLVELMGGAIGVESRAGSGSTFWFELPFARTSADPLMSATSNPDWISAGPRLRGGHYLIVDDNTLNLDVLERMLALQGARATRAGDGRAALERLRTGSADFDAVLMDVQMPVLDGLSATRAIRGELGLTELPVIAVTAGVLKDEQQRAREAGVDAVLAKPVELDQLVALLSRWPPRAADEPEADVVPVTPGLSGEPAALPVIAGLDPAHVARLVQGDIAFYRRLLSGLVTEARDAPEQVRAALAQGAATEAAARLHRLRGVAANVGAVELAATLLELETALREARPALPADLETFETQVATLLASADPWLAQTEPATPDLSASSSVDEEAELDPAQVAALREALAANRPRLARERFAELRPGLSRHYGPAVVQAIAASLAALDFPAALRALDAALSDTAAAPGVRPPDSLGV